MFKGIQQRHVIYTLLIIAVAIPLLRPFGLPLVVSDGVRDSFNIIEGLPNGSTCLMIWDAVASVFMDVGAAGVAFLDQMFRKDMNVIIVTFQENAVGSFPRALEQLKRTDLVYGEDYIDIGFIAGAEAGLAAVAQDLHTAAPVDRFGTSLAELPITANVHSVADVQLVISMSGGNPGTEGVSRQISPKFEVPIVSACAAGQATRVYVLRASGHIDGVVPGLRGGAEYEQLIHRPAYGASSMDALSMIHLFVVGLIFIGNVIHFSTKRHSEQATKEARS